MNLIPAENNVQSKKLSWQQVVAKYDNPDLRRSVWQVFNSFIPYFILWYVMYRSLAVSYWITLALSVLAAGFVVRIFIIFHDCGHGAFFKSQKASDVLGFIAGVLTFTPYYSWRHEHAMHHATAGDLDRRGVGDIWTLTVKEYLGLSPRKRLVYRIYRNPLVMFGIGSLLLFLVHYRFPRRGGGQARTPQRVLDKSGDCCHFDLDKCRHWYQGIRIDTVTCYGNCKHGWSVAVLRAPSV